MENYIVSARKYRPSNFESVVGQHALTETLRNAIRSGHLAHAYLFCGPRGVGKTTCARIFAKTINCLNPGDDHDACNECESCRAFNEQRSFNIHELDAASNNSVDDIRSIIEQVRIPPQVGKYSVYIIDEVHMLSQGAFNALLKTLEEPPSYAIFILATTEKHKVLPTILSRCQVFDFARITMGDTVRHLQYVAQQEGVNAEEEALHVVAQKADGGMRDALSIFDQLVTFCGNTISYQQAIDVLNVLDTDYYFRVVDAALKTDVKQALLLFNEVLCKGFDAGHFISGLASHLRDVLVSKDPATVQLLETSDAIRQHYAQQAAACSPIWLFKALEVVNQADINFRTARNKRLSVELMLVKLCTLLMPEMQSAAAPAPQARPAAQAPQPAPQPRPAVPVQQAAPQPRPVAQPAPQARPAAAPAPQPAPQTRQAAAPQYAAAPGLPTGAPLPGMPGIPGMPGMPGMPAQQAAAPQSAPQAAPAAENRPFTDEQVAEAWKAAGPQLFADDRRMMGMLSNIAIKRVDEFTLELALINAIQQEELSAVKSQLLGFLSSRLHNNRIRINFTIVEHQTSAVAYTAEEKLRLLASSNPHVMELKQALNLSLD